MLNRLAGLALNRRTLVMVVATVIALAGAAASTTLFNKLSAGGWDNPDAEAGQAAKVLEEEFGQAQPNLTLLVTADSSVDEPDVAAAGAQLGDRLSDEAGVRNVVSYWTTGSPSLKSTDGDKAMILAAIDGDPNQVNDRLTSLLPDYEGEHDGLDIQVGGYAMFEHELTEQSEKDVITAEMVVFPITLVVLVLVFGSVVAALLPLIVAVFTLLVGMGLMWLLASTMDLSVIAVNAVTLLGLGLSIDYSLLMVNRHREELSSGRAAGDAIRATMRTAGRTVAFSALTVAVAASALAWFPLGALRSIAYAGIITVLLAGAASLTVLPALFAMLGGRIEKGRIRKQRAVGEGNGLWHRIAMFVMHRPIPIATVVAALLLLLGSPFLGIKLGMVDERTMPASAQARQVADTIRTEFDASEQNALQIVATDTTDNLDSYAEAVSNVPNVARVDTLTGSYAAGRLVAEPGEQHQIFGANGDAFLSVVPDAGNPDEARQVVRDIRAIPAPPETLVGGQAAVSEDGINSLTQWLPWSLAVLAAVMLVLLFLLTGSVVLPFIALLLSGLSLTATFGALVWIFQDGHLVDLLGGFTVTGAIDATVPVMLFAIAFGLAMDYQVFMLSRITEEYERTGVTTSAVALGLERMGRIVTAAAVLISIVFLGFLLSDITYLKAFGIGLPLAVLLDATLVRGALLPAVMKLAGRAAWWAPAPLRRVHARFGFRDEPAPDQEELDEQPRPWVDRATFPDHFDNRDKSCLTIVEHHFSLDFRSYR